MTTRRTFLATAATGAAALATGAPSLASIGSVPAPAAGKHELPALPYAFDALEPFIDAQTMQLHHGKHHMAYVNGLNKAEDELAKARSADDYAMIQHWSKQAAFHGGGHWLHSMFWKVMGPAGKQGGGEPTGELLAAINDGFGSFAAFKKQFTAAAVAVEGSGWALLHYRHEDARLIVMQAENQHKLSSWGTTPILGVDVWEHAYYLKYQNKRPDYVAAWWNVVNWQAVSDNLSTLRR
ncbi:MAG: superoxide dismutase [Candidatus Kapabacteria bacterium]|nr:superoxide dismutase [Candidatus Kapabacteria bacterium]